MMFTRMDILEKRPSVKTAQKIMALMSTSALSVKEKAAGSDALTVRLRIRRLELYPFQSPRTVRHASLTGHSSQCPLVNLNINVQEALITVRLSIHSMVESVTPVTMDTA